MVAKHTRFRSSRNGGTPSRPAQWVEENPFASVTVIFGIGVGVGLVLGQALADAVGRKWFHHDTLTEKLTCQIRDILKSALPEGMTRHTS
ncbi:MAG: hypothetical protein ACM3U2_15325 [Deltaproteobacteria bacterium]